MTRASTKKKVIKTRKIRFIREICPTCGGSGRDGRGLTCEICLGFCHIEPQVKKRRSND